MLPHPSDAVDKTEIESFLDRLHTKLNPFTTILEMLPAGVSIAKDARCGEIWHNPVAAEFLRIETRSSFSHSVSEPPALRILHGGRELSPEELPLQIAAWQGRELEDYELEFAWEDGVRKTALYSASPLVNEQGTIMGAAATFKEITDQGEIAGFRAIECQITEALELNQGILESSPSGITTFDSSGHCIFANDAVANIVGKTKERLLQENFHFLEQWKRSGLLELAKQVLATGIARQIQIQDQSAFDQEIWLDCRLSRFTAGGEPHLLLQLDNITERKQMEREMARLDRMHLVGEMAVGIGHEIRNPMTVVRGYLQLFQIKEEFRAYKKYFDTMISELDQANAIITEYLSLAKNKGVDLKKQSLNSILEATLSPLRTEALKNNHTVALELDEIPDLLLDEKEIRQIVLNLARNGLEAMSSRGALTIKTYLDDSGVVLAVQNHGPEIPPEILEKIGTPFFTTKDSGTGLGMAVCYSIAARHNASIRIETGDRSTAFLVCFKVER